MKLNKKQKSYLIIFIMFLFIILIGQLSYFFIYLKKVNINSNKIVNEKVEILNDANFTLSVDKSNNDIYYNNYLDFISDIDKYTITNPKIIVNPFNDVYGTALIVFKTENDEKINVTLKGKNNNDLSFENDGINHIIPIYGLYPGDNEILINENKFNIQNDITINKLDYSFDNNNFILNYDKKLYLYDKDGYVRWYYDKEIDNYSLLDNDHLLITLENRMIEIDFMGYLYKEYDYKIDNINEGYVLKNNVITNIYNDKIYDLSTLLNKKINIEYFKILSDGIIVYGNNSIIKIDFDNNIKYIISNKYDGALIKKGYNFKYPSNVSYIDENENNVITIGNNYLRIYQIDQNNIKMTLNKYLKFYNINTYDSLNNMLYLKDRVIKLNNKYKVDKSFDLNGVNDYIDIVNYDYNKLEKFTFITKKTSKYSLNSNTDIYLNAELIDLNIDYYYKTLSIDCDNIYLISNKGFILEFNSNNIYLNNVQSNKYYIFIKKKGKIYNTQRYIEI